MVLGLLACQGQTPPPKGGLSPKESFARFAVPPDLELDQVLTEPEISQPVFLNFDERGRMWVVEYRQYPFPAGLKVVSRDKYWRVVYDKVPAPPPNHFRGKDRITIHQDTTGTGVFDKHSLFVDGLNIATAVVRGRGGVWVLNPPYLLFYPTKDDGDLPTGDPEVRLEGFGLEDTHSVVNSLCWGPDGWLYGAQGSTVSGHVKRPGDKSAVASMGQLIWRYHPQARRYEIFAEGGGNAFGVEIDQKGRLYSGHNGGNTRGFDYVQGGYYLKGFEKHGELSNPYAFGYFPAMPHPAVERFSHTFVINEGSALPQAYQGKLFAAAPLQSQVVFSEIVPHGSSFKTRDLGKAVTTTDTWFRPVDIKLGPDGALYIADWYDSTVSHLKNNEGQLDPDKGRIYRLRAKGEGAKRFAPVDLGRQTTDELIKLLGHDNRWVRQTVLRLLGDRQDRTVIPKLLRLVRESTGQLALEALWALHLSGGFDEDVALETLAHADPYVRLWSVRLLGDERRVSARVAGRLAKMAAGETHVEVRSQLACSARRLPARDGLPIVRQLLAHSEDSSDPHLPLLLWWALETSADVDRLAVVKLFEDPALWRLPLVEKHIVERLMRRYAQAGRQKDLLTCAELLRLAPGPEQARLLLVGFEKAFAGRPVANLPKELREALAARGGGSLALRLRQGDASAVETALKTIGDAKAKADERLQLIQICGEAPQPRVVPTLLRVLDDADHAELQQAALQALQVYSDAKIGAEIIQRYADFSPKLRGAAQALLASRATWALQFVQAVDTGKIDKAAVPLEAVRKLLLHPGDKIQELIRKHWGEIKGATTAEMRREIDRLVQVVRASQGDPYAGRKLFDASCGKCHQLFGKGGDVGPDLTPYKRDDVETLMLHIVNPSAEIREGFENNLVLTTDGLTLSGFLVERDDKIVVLRGADGQTTVISRDQIDDMKVIPQSLMPEGLLQGLADQQVRDLFAYLRSGQPLNVKD
jgi:putative heme-binding domain-containing protein